MASEKNYFVKYSRKRLLRQIFRLLGKALLALFSRPVVIGIENLPADGPAILAGNHAAVLEIVMMAVFSRQIVEFLGAGDIPLDPNLAWLANLYGYIPIRRGTLDRAGIQQALSVLNQGGIIGIFPQGGIWETTIEQARGGAALLSMTGRAPVTPIGFWGITGSLKKIFRLQRPRIVMNVGKALDLPKSHGGKPISKDELEAYSQEILHRIVELLPEEERPAGNTRIDQTFSVEISLITVNASKRDVTIDELNVDQRTALGRFFHYPILLDALNRNVGLKVKAFQCLDRQVKPQELVDACQEILNYLEKNLGFFAYRLGVEVGINLKAAFEALISIVESQSGNLTCLEIVPIYRYRDSVTGNQVEERGTPALQSI